MRQYWQKLTIQVLLVVLSLPVITAQASITKSVPYTEEEALRISQGALGKTLGDYQLLDTEGQKVQLSDYLGKPLVLNFVYSSCAHTCGVITSRLEEALEIAWDALGQDSFNVVTVGFDTPVDTPSRMRNFARERTVHGIDGWKFLSGDKETVARLVANSGFLYYSSAKGYDHLAQITVIDQKGEVVRQVYGENFDTPLLVEPLRGLVFGTITPFASLSDLVKKVRLICTIYDPKADRYKFDYSMFVKLFAGATVIGGVLILLLRELWRNRHRRKTPVH